MKTAKVILIISAFAAQGLLSAQEQNAAPEQAKAKKSVSAMTPLERARFISSVKGSRKIFLVPRIPLEGIDSGCVVAYGHYLKPPYQVESAGGAVLINGVQVTPSLVKERERAKEPQTIVTSEKKQEYAKREKLKVDAYRLYQARKKEKPEELLRQDVLAFLNGSTELVKEAYLDSSKSDTIMIRWVGETILEGLDLYRKPAGLSKSSSETKSDILRKNSEIAKQEKYQIEMALRNGTCFVFHSNSGRTIMGDNRTSRFCVRKAMTEEVSGTDERVGRIAKCFDDDYQVALDIVENYDEKEWE